MSPSTAAGLVLGDVAVGDALPILDVDVTPTTVVLGALASRDWRPMHHDYKFATERNGVADIFLNTPNQAAWIERYITDWTGPKGRIGRMKFRMRDSVFPGDRMSYRGTVTGVGTDDAGVGWVDVEITLLATPVAEDGALGAEKVATTVTARVAVPTDDADNPWARRGNAWQP
jgi:acyl dehydratase